ncbi:OB-fold protein [Clostridium tyrobutyricum]|jgi:hypothetical protein|uniref:OB-fold protein n=1 Tax=Clostridium tyrobutyricum TaxID=1519 RepID=UPI001C38FB5A|nr:OB-fold putative lipoprotein [Clostridium tyrobutyricum]MBV4423156.1 OB-fold putative lipoprotein [Clostridium tyrobutyricum]MBV4424925.1 OB-fold putative lipoprotein [Clostridium tyrobutyricum]
MKKTSILFIGVILSIVLIGCGSQTQSNNTTQTKQIVQKQNNSQEPTQDELNTKLKKDATKADFVQLNGNEDKYKGKKVFVEGTVSSITTEGSTGGEFTITAQEGTGYGMYGITSLDTKSINVGKDIVKNSKVKAYGTVDGKDSIGSPHIVATIVQKQ